MEKCTYCSQVMPDDTVRYVDGKPCCPFCLQRMNALLGRNPFVKRLDKRYARWGLVQLLSLILCCVLIVLNLFRVRFLPNIAAMVLLEACAVGLLCLSYAMRCRYKERVGAVLDLLLLAKQPENRPE